MGVRRQSPRVASGVYTSTLLATGWGGHAAAEHARHWRCSLATQYTVGVLAGASQTRLLASAPRTLQILRARVSGETEAWCRWVGQQPTAQPRPLHQTAVLLDEGRVTWNIDECWVDWDGMYCGGSPHQCRSLLG